MRRILSIALVVLMLLSAATVGVFTVSAENDTEAPVDATPINDANDFALMDPDGVYVLAADITVDSTYNQTFTGTLYGNGKKVTVSAPLFSDLSGATVKDLVLEGEIVDTSNAASYIGALAVSAGDAVIDGVVNNVKITSNRGHVAGILAFARGAADITILNCVNNAAISTGDANGAGYASGILAYSEAETTIIENCVNNGEIKSDRDGAGDATCAGGIIGRVTSANGLVEVYGCVNNGDVTGHRPGGIWGTSENIRKTVIENCINNGDVTSPTNYCGGIVCRIDAKSTATYRACVNTGKVSHFKSQAGGILGYSGFSNNSSCRNRFYACVNAGVVAPLNYETISKEVTSGGIMGVGNLSYAYGCANIGEVYATGAAGGIFGRTGIGTTASSETSAGLSNCGYSVTSNCFNGGKVVTRGDQGGGTNSVGGIVGYCWGALFAYNNVVAGEIVAENVTVAGKGAAGIVSYANNGECRFLNNYILADFNVKGTTIVVDLCNTKSHDFDTKLGIQYFGNCSSTGLSATYCDAKKLSATKGTAVNKANYDSDEELAALLNKLVGYEAFVAVTEADDLYGMVGVVPAAVAYAQTDAEAVAVGTEAEFLAMKPNGNYYLTADITLGEGVSYEKTFSGTLDGKGFTLTVSAPVFEVISDAVVTDLKIKGEIVRKPSIPDNANGFNGTYTTTNLYAYTVNDHAGALAAVATNSTVSKIVNEANVKAWESAGGIIGSAYGGTYTDCANFGTISGRALAGGIIGSIREIGATVANCVNNGGYEFYYGGAYTGGIIGYVEFADVTVENCVNEADLYAAYNGNRAGGIVGYVLNTGWKVVKGTDTARAIVAGYLTVNGCVNNGQIDGADQVGGIAGWVEGVAFVNDTVNNGNVKSHQNYAGGFIGRTGSNSGQAGAEASVFTNCVNNGDVSGHRQFAAGILGHTQESAYFYSCVNTGKIMGEHYTNPQSCKKWGCHDTDSTCHYQCGGILGTSNWNAKFVDCVNTGDIIANQNAGGIAAAANTSGKAANGLTGKIVFENCLNTGNIYNANLHGPYAVGGATINGVGGIVGKACSNLGSAAASVTFKNCVSFGELKAEGNQVVAVGGIAGDVVSSNATIENCYSAATLVAVGEKGATYALTTFRGKFTIKNTFVLDSVVNYYETADGVVAVEGNANVFANYELYSGQLAYRLNTGAGKQVFFQELGVDEAPSVYVSDNFVVGYDEENNIYFNVVEDDTTTEDETTTEEVTTEQVTTEQVTTEQVTTEQVTTEQVTTEQVTTEEVTTEEVTTEEVTTEVVTTEVETTKKPDETTEEPKGGCGSVIGVSLAVLAVAVVAPVAIVLKKDEE